VQILRTRFRKDIVSEFLPPTRRNPRKPEKVIILCAGAPSVPSRRLLIEFFARKGYWVFFPRYRGTWESGSWFLRLSPERDIRDIIDQLPRGFEYLTLRGKKRVKVKPDAIYLIAGSFGGPAGILASRDSRVSKVVCVSPVVDWRAPSKTEPISFLEKFLRFAFGNGYRFRHRDFLKLKGGKFYNPMAHWREIDGKKLLIYHAKDDKSVRWNEVARFAKLTGAKLILRKRGGHLSTSLLMKPLEYRRLNKFFREGK
jgi:pimeloyl-ACP methyl ester carboxylesterase